MMRAVDLHVHSTCSDGTVSPARLVDLAMEAGLAAFALTDHDSINGLEEAISYAEELKKRQAAGGFPAPVSGPAAPARKPPQDSPQGMVPEVIPGIELSTEYRGRDIHIVGLFIDYQDPAFLSRLQEFIDSRTNRNRKMCVLLREAGVDITYEKLQERFPGCVLTRAHYARYLLEKGYTKSISEAFERYVGDHCPCYVPREKISPAQAIRLILDADGIPILAHPILYRLSDERLEELVRECKEAGLMGIEAIYSTYQPHEERQIRRLAEQYRLLLSGGSDFHGNNKPSIRLGVGRGSLFVPESILDDLKKTRCNLLFTDMDGTLLNNASEISPPMREALRRMSGHGHHLILSSGRPLPSILEVCRLQRLDFPHMLIISNNGALVYDCDRQIPILEHRMELEDIRYIVEEAEKRHLHIHAYTDSEIVCHHWNEELRYYTRRIHLPLKCVDDIPGSLEKGSYKLQCIHLTDRKALEDFRDHIAPYCGDRIQMIFSNDQYLEILSARAGKGSALRFVQEYLHVPHSHTYAAGDAENDISMLRAAHTGIAMANAAPCVKEAADMVTALDNEHDGLLELIGSW